MMNEEISNHPIKPSVQNPQRLSQLANYAILSKVIFVAVAFLLPLVSEFSFYSDNISELALGRFGFIQTAAFIISGLGTLGLAYAVRKQTVGAPGSFVGSLLIAVYGLGAILAAIFPTDQIDTEAELQAFSVSGAIHTIVSIVSILSVIIGMFLLMWTFRNVKNWRSFPRWGVLFPLGAFALFFAQSENPAIGVLQRLLVLLISAWIVIVALKVRSIASED